MSEKNTTEVEVGSHSITTVWLDEVEEPVNLNREWTVRVGMGIKSKVYNSLPKPVQPFVKRTYENMVSDMAEDELHSEFVSHFFDSEDEYLGYVDEFNEGSAVELRNEALEKYQQLTGKGGLSGIGLDASRDYYAVTRKIKPETVVETGVCNGVSTLSILLALRENDKGELFSIDYPLRADESLEEFRQETFEGYGGAAIPSDKEPGWIVPSELRTRWDLTLGKSQRELPRLVTELDTLDLFIHDSEHSHPCMMFEYEIAYEWLEENGAILSDDITWNDAFSVFTDIREPDFGKMSRNIGYISKIK